MRELWLYNLMDRAGVRNYRAKIMLMAFLGTHIPLIALISYFAFKSSADWPELIATVGTTLVATLIGTAMTLLVLNHLLRPVLMTARTLRDYRQTRDVGTLPTGYRDEAGTLMADASNTLVHLEQALDTLKFTDASTGLSNRGKLLLDLQRRFAAGLPFAACAIRLVNYGRLLETFDLAAAEVVAREVATRLKAASGHKSELYQTKLYRLNGADLMLLMTAPPGQELTVAACATRLRALTAAADAGIMVQALAIDPVLRAGVALWPEDAATPDQLVDNALAAIGAGADDARVSFHSPAARHAAVERLQMEQDIRRALDADEFVLHYQPVVDLSLNRVIGAEALIRWQHPQRGLVPPGKFIGVAEQTGLIDPIGMWVMRQACLQVKAWNGAGTPGMKVAVNLSARQFLDPELINHVDEALNASGIVADQLEIELTETAAMADHDYTRNVFGKLRDRGVSIAIDDFGTGYAGMSYLRKLPFDKLKIDREFVTNVHRTRDGQAICSALVTLARGLGLRVLAEGTESEEEVRYLWSRGCELFQGFYFSKPLAEERFADGVHTVAELSAALTSETGRRARRVTDMPVAG